MRKMLPVLTLWAFGMPLIEAVQAQQLPASLVPGQYRPGMRVVAAQRQVSLQPQTVPQSRTTATWTAVTSMSQARGQHAAAAVGGKVYVWGGYIGGPSGTLTEFNSLEIYNPATNSWSAGAAYPIVVRGQAHAVGNDGLIYSFGGASGGLTASSYRYNPATNAWTAIASMITAMWQASAVTGNDGRIYMFGGFSGIPAETITQIYNPTTNSWTTGASMPTGRHGYAAAKDASGLIHVIGGTSQNVDGSTALTLHQAYNPTTNTWTTLAALPVGLNQAGATLGADGKIYVVGGKASYVNNTGPFYNSVYVYNPSTDSWTQDNNIPLTLGETRSVTLGTELYTLAGTNGAQQAVAYRTSVANSYSWTGATSTAWAVGSNWSGGVVPTATDDVTIPGGLARYPVVTTSTATARNVTVNGGGTLTVNDGGTLSVTGNFGNNGTFAANGNATVALTGSLAQSVGGSSTTQFRNLTVGTSGASLTGRTEIQRLLTLTGNLATNGQRFLILSNYLGTAMVVNNGGVVNGGATVQRYIDPAGNAGFGYRHWATPVTGATLANLDIFPSLPGAQTAGPFQLNAAYNTASAPSTVTPFPTVFSYSETRVTGSSSSVASFDQGWQSPTSSAQVLGATFGFTINQPAGNFFEVTGTSLNASGSFSRINLTRGTAPDAGWHLLGNPYPSPIDWNGVTRTNVDAAAYVYRSTGQYAGGYTAYVNGVGNNVLPMSQAFFVRVSAPGAVGNVTFPNSARLTTYTDPTYSRPAAETRPLLQLTLQRQGATGPASQDALYVYEQAGATAAFDANFDALKVQLNGGQQPTLYQQAGSESLAIQGVPVGNQPLAMPLGLNAPVAGTYLFSPEQLINFAATDQIMLEDRQTGTWHNLRQGAYAAQLPQGLSTTRFVLHFNAARPLTTTKSTWAGEVQVYPNPTAGAPLNVAAAGLRGTTAQVRLLSALGQTVRTVSAPITGSELRLTLPTAGLAAGVYTLQLSTDAGTLTRKITVQ